MAEIVAIILVFVFTVYFGAFNEILLAVGLITIVGFVTKRTLRPNFYALLTLLSTTSMIGIESFYSFLLPGLIVAITRFMTGDRFVANLSPLWVIAIPPALLLSSISDNSISAIPWLILGAIVPLPQSQLILSTQRPVSYLRLCGSVIAIASITLMFISPQLRINQAKTVILKGGEWANTDIVPTLQQHWNISSMYSYSELKSLLHADTIDVDHLTTNCTEAWLITPTRPMAPSQIKKALSWVQSGGHLIVVTDHTDLFGHGRVVNSLLSSLSLKTSLTAFFPSNAKEPARGPWGERPILKTANVQYGIFLWPIVTARWWNERVDYSGRNFFGPLSPSIEDGQGRRIICGSKSYGRGTVTVLGDSTILANFAIYQPGTIDFIEHLRSIGILPPLFLLSCLLIILTVVIGTFIGYREPQYALPILGLFVLCSLGTHSVNWDTSVWWSGDREAVCELGDPRERISTAYSLSFLSGMRPRWTENPMNLPQGIWVSKEPPPTPNWRWVDLSESPTPRDTYDTALDPLLDVLNNNVPRVVEEASDWAHVCVGEVWSDSAIGDWWFDRGISESKYQRLRSWISWLQKKDYMYTIELVKLNKTEFLNYMLIIDGQHQYKLKLPRIIMREGSEIYLGKGVSAEVVRSENKLMLLGGRTFTEGWGGPSAWVLIEDDAG